MREVELKVSRKDVGLYEGRKEAQERKRGLIIHEIHLDSLSF